MNSNLEVLIESFKQNHPVNKHDRLDSVIDSLQYLSYTEQLVESANTTVEKSYAKSRIARAINTIQESLIKENTFKWPYSVAPYFTPEEVEQFKGYYYESTPVSVGDKNIYHDLKYFENELRATTDPDRIADIKAEIDRISKYSGEAEDFYESTTYTVGDKNIFHDLKYFENELHKTNDPERISVIKAEIDRISKYSGEAEEFYESGFSNFEPISWVKNVTELTMKLEMEEDPERIDCIKQSLVNLGWNPEIEFNKENQLMAKKRIESIYQEKYKNIFTLDVTSLVEATNTNEEVIYENSNSAIKPIHVIVTKVDSPFSKVITTATRSDFAHAAICIDNDFTKLYSYNLINGVNKVGGFSIENINDYPENGRLAVFSFFVTNDVYECIYDRIKLLTDNIHKTTYSIVNILTLPFKNINLNLDNSMICSQFVDSIMKMANIDITGKDSSHVTPGDVYKSAVASKGKVYKVFDGLAKDFNPKKIIAYVNKLIKKIKPTITEGVSNLLADYIYPVVMEAKFPIEFNKDGDALITNKFVDFDREYSASHKLLLHYAKAGNTEAMKYELARLYYMNYILERRLYHNKSLSNKEKNMKTRARVLNDFNKYLKYVLEKEPKFNFSEYYEKSVFYPHTIEVKSGTILKLKDVINYIL